MTALPPNPFLSSSTEQRDEKPASEVIPPDACAEAGNNSPSLDGSGAAAALAVSPTAGAVADSFPDIPEFLRRNTCAGD